MGAVNKNIHFHRINVRVATDEELGLGEVAQQIAAQVSSEAKVRATAVAALTETQNNQESTIGSLSATVSQQGTTLATVDGVVQAMTGLTATTETEDGVTYVSGLLATTYSNPDGTGGSVLQLLGDEIIAEGSLSIENINVENLVVTGQMINNDAISRRYFSPAGGGTAVFGSTVAVSNEVSADFVNYIPVDPAVPNSGVRNPISVIVSGYFKPLSAADGRFSIDLQGRVGSGGWTTIDGIGTYYHYAEHYDRVNNFDLFWVDDGIGQVSSGYDEYRLVARQVLSSGPDVQLISVQMRMEQLNGLT